MKKITSILFAFALMAVPVIAFAQPTDPEPPTDSIAMYFYSLTGVAGITVIVSMAIINGLSVSGSTIKQIITWIIAMGVSWAGYFFGIGMYENITIGWTIVLGLASGLLSNGIYDITFVQMILEFLKLKIPTKK